MPISNSFTVTATDGRLRELKTHASIGQPFNPALPDGDLGLHQFQAIWDTGATTTVITQNVVDACGLKPIGMVRVSGVNSVGDCEVFLVSLHLPNNVRIAQVRATKGDLHSGVDILIGMDIITLGDFSVTNKDGKTVFSFRVPSQVHTDYVKDHHEQAAREAQHHGSHRPAKQRKKRPGKNFGKNKNRK